MGFDLVKFLTEIALSVVEKDGASKISMLVVLIVIAVLQIIKLVDKRKELKRERLKKEEEIKNEKKKKEEEITNKKKSIYRMGEHEERISIVLEKILNKLYDRNILRACVMQISNGGEFLNNVKLLKLHMTYEERITTKIRPIKYRYNQVMLNGKYDKLFSTICISKSCFLKVMDVEAMKLDFADDPDIILYMHILCNDNDIPIGMVMIGFLDLDKNLETYIHTTLHNHIMEIEKILKS